MRKAICLLLVLSPVLLPAAGARAQSQGPYFGVGVGSSNASFNPNDFSLGLPQVSESQTKTSTGAKAFAGFRFNRYVGAEVAYVDLGTFKYHYDGGGAGSADLDYKASGFTLSGLVILPMSGEFSFFGRVGAFGSTAKISIASATGSIPASLANAGIASGSSDSSSKTNLYFGVGAQYDLTPPFALRVEYENYGEVGDGKDTGRVKVSLISASLLFRF